METTPPRDPLARERSRRHRAEQVQRRRLVLGICLLLLIVLIVALAVGLSGGGGGTASSTTSSQSTATSLAAATYTADLTGADSVPPLPTNATGSLTLTYDPDAATFTFVLEINGLTNPSVAKIYEGVPGSSGAALLTLFAGPAEEGVFSGVLAQGTVEAAKLTGSLTDMNVGDLIALIEAGDAYVSVGNTAHPIDAIRGQIK